jgi:hypothetical protein
MTRFVRWGLVPIVLAVCLASACSKSGNRQAVSGTVFLKGAPLDEGTIEFVPTTKDIPTTSGAVIKDGKFSIPADKGLAPGQYVVRVSSGEKGTQAAEAAPGVSGPPAKDRIPPEYNANSNLKAEVKDGGPNVFEFKIP